MSNLSHRPPSGRSTPLWVIAAVAAIGLASPASAQSDEASNGSNGSNASLAPHELPQHLVKVLRTSNKAQTNRYIPKVYDFQNVNPYAVILFVRRVMEIEEGAWFSFATPEMTSGKLLVVFPEYQETYLDALMERLDRPNITSLHGTGRAVYEFKHRDALDPDLTAVIGLEGTPTVTILPDTQINHLFIEDAPSGLARVLQQIEAHDVPTPQVEFAVTVYEIDLTDDGQIGLDYISWKNGPGRNLFALGAFAEREKISTLNSNVGPNSSALLYNSGKGTYGLPGQSLESTGRNAAYLYEVPSAYFDFLVAKGCATIMTQSKIVALNRSAAILEVGDEILYYQEKHLPDARAGSRLQPLDPFGNLNQINNTAAPNEITDFFGVTVADHPDNRVLVPTTTARSLGTAFTGFYMEVRPTINQKGCTCDLFLSLVQLTGFDDDGTPVLASRSIDTLIKIPHDSREITIGGLTRTRRIDGTNKIPWLGDIPVLGGLFGGTTKIEHKTLVVTTLRARRVGADESNATDADEMTRRAAIGEITPKTLPNDPGFLQK